MAFLTFQNFIFFLGPDAPRPEFVQMLYSYLISEIIECLERHTCMSGSQACRVSPHGPLEKEMCHLKAETNKSFWMFTEPDTISLFCL